MTVFRLPRPCWLLFLLLIGLADPAAILAAEVQSRLSDVVFQADVDGSTERYAMIQPKGFSANQPTDLLIALHGHGSDRFQFAQADRDECKAARDVAAKYKMLFVSPDYRAKTSWMGPKAEADV